MTDIPKFWLPVAAVAALWTPAMIAASHAWSHGEYYDYGWFVPPAALFLTIKRWKESGGPVPESSQRRVVAMAALLVPWILVLRVLGNADPTWRLPMILLGITAAAASHLLIAASRGSRVSAGFIWITLLWLSAIPWPSVVESRIVHFLTHGVISAVAEVFQIFGTPVEVVGDRLVLHATTVEVTDGCSGVRSFQSFIMATWFFVELQRLKLGQAFSLLACACAVAFIVNAARTHALATIRFDFGEQAFERAHDWLGLLAFLASAGFFYFLSGSLGTARRTAITRRVERAP